MKRFPKSKGKIQALNICLMQYTVVEGSGAEWVMSVGYDTFGDPLICTVDDIEWAMDYIWERCHRVVE